jgi:hypothetical protein
MERMALVAPNPLLAMRTKGKQGEGEALENARRGVQVLEGCEGKRWKEIFCNEGSVRRKVQGDAKCGLTLVDGFLAPLDLHIVGQRSREEPADGHGGWAHP